MILALSILLCFPVMAQLPVWNPPVFQTLKPGYPVKIAVESMPITESAPSASLGFALADRIAVSFKPMEPKLILLAIQSADSEKADVIAESISAKFSRAIVVGLTVEESFTHRQDDSQEQVSALILAGGDLKFSAVLADENTVLAENSAWNNPFNISEYFYQTLLQTTQDKAIFILSSFDKQKSEEIEKSFLTKIEKRVPVFTLQCGGKKPGIYFNGRKSGSACAAFAMAGNIALTKVNISDTKAEELTSALNSMEEKGVQPFAVIACLPPELKSQQIKPAIQNQTGKLTPIWGVSSADSGVTILFSPD